jgi:DNA repair exonuclease SbcCD ATPase subunit
MESSPEPSTAKPDSKTWKEKIEDNPIWYIGRIAAACFVLGFGAGYGAYDRHLAITKTETISRAELESLRRSAPTEQINTLKSDIAQKDNKIAQVNAQLAQKSYDLEVLTERCNKLESQRNSYEAEMKKNQQLIADLRSQRDAQSKQITGLKKQIQEAADQRKSDQAEIAKSQELLKNQAEEVNRLKDQLKTSRSKVGAGEKGPPTVQTPRAQMHGFTFEPSGVEQMRQMYTARFGLRIIYRMSSY